MRVSSIFCFSLLLVPFFANAGVFGPSTYEECILQGAKEAKTDAAVVAIQDACERKFKKSSSNANSQDLISSCSVVWMGDRFVKGKPADQSKYARVRFTSSPDNVYFPEQMPPENIKALILKNRGPISKLCPGITFD